VSKLVSKKHIITIAGRPGSGKSTTAKAIAEQLGYKHFSSGDLFRALGKERGVDVLKGNMTPGVTEDLDHLVDSKLREIGEKDDKVVIDSRTAWHWIPSSFKVFLNLDVELAAQRILNEANESRVQSEKISDDAKDYAKALEHRLKVETDRYKAIYDIDPYDMNNYDLIIDTSVNSVEDTVSQLLQDFKEWLDR
jgi:CMP/dCMP kinase